MDDLPIYCVVDVRPVKVVAGSNGGIEVLAYDLETGTFVRRMDLLDRVILQDDWVVELTEEEFDAHVARLREQDALKAG
ncbi:MAG: hypothetical protein WBV82_32355 [Myxococcaceae bacterium]